MTFQIEPVPYLKHFDRSSEHFGDRSGFVRLDRNEGLVRLEKEIFQKILNVVEPELLSQYPDTEDLYRALSKALGISQRQLVLSAGSDGGIKLICQAYLRPRDVVLMPDPTYAMYPIYAAMFGCEVRTVGFGDALDLDLDGLLAGLRLSPRMLALPNPNQPTGTIVKRQELERILHEGLREGVLVLVDEAYYPFYPESALDMLADYPNLVIVRSFSKSAGLPGLRLGFVVGSEEIASNLAKVRSAYDLNVFTLAIGKYVVEHPEIIENNVLNVLNGRSALIDRASAIGITCPQSFANFQHLELPNDIDGHTTVEELRKYGFLVKGPYTHGPFKNSIRVTVGPPDVMCAFMDALTEILEDGHR